MLSKLSRLSAVEVREILKGGRSARSATLSAKYVRAQGARAAVVVSSKVAKTAVLRNKLRRAAYSALRTALPKNIHVVFFLHKPLLDPAELQHLCLKLS
jgi:ribonuclease P protein component